MIDEARVAEIRNKGTRAVRERAAMIAGTVIDKWMRANPDATPQETCAEFLRLYEVEIDASLSPSTQRK